MQAPTPDDVRRTLAPLDTRQQKIVTGMLAAMIQDASRVREREWVAERLTEITLLAGEFPADSPQDGVRVVQEFLEQHAGTLLNASFVLFQRVGLDLAPRAATGFSFEEALRCGLEYLPPAVDSAPPETHPEAPRERELGEQPLARRMAEKGLDPSDLVTASGEQLTHKMVRRAMKGRRLTAGTMGKVLRAWNKAAVETHVRGDLFDYEP